MDMRPGGHMSPEALERKLRSLKPGERFQYEGVSYWRDAQTGELKSKKVIVNDSNDGIGGKSPL